MAVEMVSVEKEVQMELRENSYSVIGGGGTGGGGGGGGYSGSNGCGVGTGRRRRRLWTRVERLVEYLMIQTGVSGDPAKYQVRLKYGTTSLLYQTV